MYSTDPVTDKLHTSQKRPEGIAVMEKYMHHYSGYNCSAFAILFTVQNLCWVFFNSFFNSCNCHLLC